MALVRTFKDGRLVYVDPEKEAQKEAEEAERKRVAESGRTSTGPRPEGGKTAPQTWSGTPGDKPGSDEVIAGIRAKKARGEPLTPEEEQLLAGYDNGQAGPTRATSSSPPGTGWNGDLSAVNAASKSLTDLRDRFLSERGLVSDGAPALDRSQSDEVRALQLGQAARLDAMVSGQAPSIADAQRRAAMLDANQNVLGLAAAARPGDGGGARRAAFRQFSDSGRRVGLDAALVKANEVSQANQQLGALLGQTRAGDTQLALADAENALKARGLGIEERMGLGKLGLDAQTTESETQLRTAQIQNMRDQLDFAYEQLAQAKDENERNRWFGVVGSILGALGGIGAAAVGSGK